MKTATTALILSVGSLMALGIVMLYSSSMAKAGGAHYLMMQGISSGVGACLCLVMALADYRNLKKFAIPFLILTVVVLLLVLVPGIGVFKNGSRRWFNLAGFSFQPSELAKLALIIILAWYGETFQREMRTFWKGLVIPGLIALALVTPVFLEPDRGTTILLCAITGLMLLLAGIRWFYFIPPAVGSVALMAFVLISDSVRMKRILSWLHPEDHKSGAGYQAWQAMIALGSGGVSGLGLGNGRQKLGFVPENHTDFILSVVGEEMGLIATLAVLCTFVVLLICGVYIAWNSRDVFGLLLGSGITFLIALQAMINVGVVTSALPNKGLPLPFVSYGGSSLLLMLFAVGILISIARQGGSPAMDDEEMERAALRHTRFA